MGKFVWILIILFASTRLLGHSSDEPIPEVASHPQGEEGDRRSDREEELVPNPLKVKLTEEERDHIRSVNQERKKAGLSALAPALSLMKAAQEWSQYMQDNNKFHHRQNGLPGKGWRAENIAAGKATVEGTMNQWMNSAGHRDNILDANYKYIGVGHASGNTSKYKHYWTQNFSSEQ